MSTLNVWAVSYVLKEAESENGEPHGLLIESYTRLQ